MKEILKIQKVVPGVEDGVKVVGDGFEFRIPSRCMDGYGYYLRYLVWQWMGFGMFAAWIAHVLVTAIFITMGL